MGKFLVCSGTAHCYGHGAEARVELQFPISFYDDDVATRVEFESGDALDPYFVETFVEYLVTLREGLPEDAGTALMRWWCPECEDYSTVAVRFETRDDVGYVADVSIVPLTRQTVSRATWMDGDLLREVLKDASAEKLPYYGLLGEQDYERLLKALPDEAP